MHRLFQVAFSLLFSSLVFGQSDQVRNYVAKLCSEEFHGRGYVERGDSLAASYIKEQFEQIGAEAIEGDFLQGFNLDVNTFPGKMKVSQGSENLNPGEDFVVEPYSGSLKGSFAPQKVDMKTAMSDKKLIALIDEVMSSFEKKKMGLLFSAVGLKGDSLNRINGIAYELTEAFPVFLIVDEKFTWSVAREQHRFPCILIQESAYQVDAPFNIEIEAKMIRDYSSYNVIAKIPSKKKCTKKTIVFSAHYDHLGRMGSETYFPGANDNASGTAMLLSLAEHYVKNPSDNNIVFIAFAGEEAGLVGSKYYTENPLFPIKRIKFLVNLDIMGSGEEGITAVNATLFEDQFETLQQVNSEKNYLTKIKSRGPAANSDHYWFTELGVPCFFIYTMGPNKHYHDVFDTYEELSFAEYNDLFQLLIDFEKEL
jgi:aminopeptidase YwaD